MKRDLLGTSIHVCTQPSIICLSFDIQVLDVMKTTERKESIQLFFQVNDISWVTGQNILAQNKFSCVKCIVFGYYLLSHNPYKGHLYRLLFPAMLHQIGIEESDCTQLVSE